MGLKEQLISCRESKNCRLGIIWALIVVVILLLIFWGKAKAILWAILIILFVALGIQVADYDLDLWKLWQTGGNIQESRVMQKWWLKVFWSDCISNNLNCSNFKTQAEAQAKYDMCAEKIAADNNATKDAVRNIDVFGLDKDKDGVVCEALPKWLKPVQ